MSSILETNNKLNEVLLERDIYKEILFGMSNISLEESVYDQVYKTLHTLLKAFNADKVSLIKKDEVSGLFPMSVTETGTKKVEYNPVMKNLIYNDTTYSLQIKKYNFVQVAYNDIVQKYPNEAAHLSKEKISNFILMILEHTHGSYFLVIENYKLKPKDINIIEIIYNYIDFALKSFLYSRNLYHLSNVDSLTNLYNRNKFNSDIDILKNKNINDTILVFVDLDKLKFVNDTFGHNAGDKLLIDTADILKVNINYGKIYRIGGDEFVIIIEGYDIEVFEKDIKKVKKALKDNNIYCSIGWVYEKTNGDIDRMFAKAEKEMYLDKNSKH